MLKQDTANINTHIKGLEKIVVQELGAINPEEKVKIEPYLNSIRNNLTENIIDREFRKEVNLAKAVSITADILSQDDGEPPKEQVEQDWIDRFREFASNTTTEEIQQLWGRILAGEIKSPGKHSLRTLEFIKNLSQKEALEIEKLFSFVINDDFIVKSFNSFYDYGSDALNSKLSFKYLSDMQAIGLLSGVETSLTKIFSPIIIKEINFYVVWFRQYDGQQDAYGFTHDDLNKKLILEDCFLTQLGKELHDLCHVEMDTDYLNYIVKSLEEQGFKKVPKNQIRVNFV